MSRNERPLILAANAWWRAYRPCDYDQKDHLANPTVNTIGKTEARLAQVVADRILENSRARGRK